MWLVSKMIPKNDKDVEGPSILSVAMGAPNSAHKDTNVFTLHRRMQSSSIDERSMDVAGL